MIDDVNSFTQELIGTYKDDDLVLAVSSNGRLRYFLALIPNEFESRLAAKTYSVKTGQIGKLNHQNGRFNVQYWNLEPHAGLGG